MSTHQMFGSYLGRITPDNGGAVESHDLFAWIGGSRSALLTADPPVTKSA